MGRHIMEEDRLFFSEKVCIPAFPSERTGLLTVFSFQWGLQATLMRLLSLTLTLNGV